MTSIDDLLRQAASIAPDVEVAFPAEVCSYSELDRRVDRFAEALQQAGILAGDRVGVWLRPSVDYVAMLFAVARSGGVTVPISDRFRTVELAHALTVAAPRLVVTCPADEHLDRPEMLTDTIDVMRETNPSSPRPVQMMLTDGRPVLEPRGASETGTWPGPPSGPPTSTSAPDMADLALLLFTSGTSSAPKACMLGHHGLLLQAAALARESYQIEPTSVVWSPLPLFHIAGIVSLLASVSRGASFVHSGTFEPSSTLRLVRERRITHALAAFETIWMRLFDHADYRGNEFDTVRVGLTANGPQQLQSLEARLPHVAFIANYGSTEACGHVTMGHADEPFAVRGDASGLPLAGYEIQIVDTVTGSALAAGETGEIWFRGPAQSLGYYGDVSAEAEAEADAAADADGWLHSGDLGVLDPAGRMRFCGRLKDMLKVGGENVSAAEVEAYLAGHPAVAVAAVVGVGDDYYGQVPVAFVQLMRGADTSQAELQDYCVDRIASYKVPRYVRFVEDWPMSGTKIRKHVLGERIAAELAAAGVSRAPRMRTAPRADASLQAHDTTTRSTEVQR